MNDQSPASSLAERALDRLRKIAAGNGLEPAAITPFEKEEQVFTLQGRMEVSPLSETETASYPGGPRGRDRKPVESFAALQGAVDKHKEDFRQQHEWIAKAAAEIRAHESQGWGLENAKVTLPDMSAIYAATQTCPSCEGRKVLTCVQCQGRGTVTCNQCQGQGRELCYYCAGRGEDPQQPGQRCHTCNGTRYAPCRFCQTHGYLPCPTCHGKRGTPCTACQATGQMTQEVTVTCGATTHFKLIVEGLPSGLRRGLDRIGVANLGKGHADITASDPSKALLEDVKEGAPIPVVAYQAVLPYAEMRIGFGGKKAVISAVGKRCAMSGVPNFLDDTLKPWRDKLRQAAAGHAPLDDALEGRAIRDILSLTVSGKGRVEEVRKLYPFGLSIEAINAILSDVRLALNKTTLKTRTVIAVMCGVVCAGISYLLFPGGVEGQLNFGRGPWVDAATDVAMLAAMLAASWAALNFSARFVLQRRFPQLQMALQQKIGKTGYSMIASIVAVFVICLFIAPIKPLWLVFLIRR